MSLWPSERAEVRRNRYKVAVDTEEGRRRRDDNMVEIRKSRREKSLLKKRRDGLSPSAATAAAPQMTYSSALQQKLEGLPAMVQVVLLDNSAVQLEATTQFRKLLSIGGDCFEAESKVLRSLVSLEVVVKSKACPGGFQA